MIEEFRENFRTGLAANRTELAQNGAVVTMMEPLFGLLDENTYNNWKMTSDMRYVESSNLIRAMKERDDSPILKQLAEDLLGTGYDTAVSPDFDPEQVQSQLNIIEAIASNLWKELMKVLSADEEAAI